MTTVRFSSAVGFSSLQPLLPIFNCEKYEWWSIKVKTLLRSQELWDLVEYGYVDILEPNEEEEEEEEERLKEIKKRDAKALFILQQAFHENIFSRIAATTTLKQAWTILQKEFQGDARVMVIKLQSLRREFETLLMKNGESIADFLSRAMTIVNQMHSYGEQISNETIVAKVLRSLTPKFDHVVAAIEEAKDLSTLSIDELMGSLQAHESRINRSFEKNEEKAFQVKVTNDHSTSRGQGRGEVRGRGRGYSRGRGRGRSEGQRQSNEQGNTKSSIQCYHCNRYGHLHADCWYKNQHMNFAAERCYHCNRYGHVPDDCWYKDQNMNLAGETEEECKLFMACIDTNQNSSDLWFVDSGCSNHMTGTKSLFQELDETQKIKVQLGTKRICKLKE